METLYDYVVRRPLGGNDRPAYIGRSQVVVRATNVEQARERGAAMLECGLNEVVVEAMQRTEPVVFKTDG